MSLNSKHLLGLDGMKREDIQLILDTAVSFREVLDRPAEAAADLRRRVLAAAHARWTWERQTATLLEVYERLTGRPW